jgi:hypothetical protein
MEWIIRLSPRGKARLAGVFEALEGLPAVFGQVIVFGMLVVPGNASVTANNILAHQTLYRVGFAVPVVAVGFHIVWALLFYQLFQIVNRTISMLATFVILVGCAVQAIAALLYLAPLVILQNASSLGAFNTAQVQDLAYFFTRLSPLSFDVYLIFFGLWCVLIGYLIFESTFMPRILGVLLALDGVCWMCYLVPPFVTYIFPVIAVVSGAAEISLLVWLLIFGVNSQRWYEQADATAAPSRSPMRLEPESA